MSARTNALAGAIEAAEGALPPAPADYDGGVDGWCARQPLNDVGNASRLLARVGTDLVSIEGAGWAAWDGRRWSTEDGERLARLHAQALSEWIKGEIAVIEGRDPKDDALVALRKWARACGNSERISNALRELAPRVTRRVDEMDAHADLLTVANGTVEMGPKSVLRPARREDLITRSCGAPWIEGATGSKGGAPIFEAFVERILPDVDVRLFLRRWLGYSITGHMREQVVVMLWGSGSNGKSTLLNVVAHVVGDYAAKLPIASVLVDERKSGSQATPDIARLPGARMVSAAEPDVGRRLSESAIKDMTSGEKMIARHLNHPFFEFIAQFKVTLAFNTKPATRGQDEGLWRRLLLVPFTERVSAEDVGPVYEALEREAPGILAWLIAGAEDWYENGLAPPPVVTEATSGYRTEGDAVGAFLITWCVLGEAAKGESVRASILWRAWQMWCRDNAEEPGTQTLFGRKLVDHGLRKERIGTVFYTGIALGEAARAALAAAHPGEGVIA